MLSNEREKFNPKPSSKEGLGQEIIRTVFPKRESSNVSKGVPKEEPKRSSLLQGLVFGSSQKPLAGAKDTSIFKGKPSLKRWELRQVFRRASPVIPGTGGVIISQAKRVKKEREWFTPGKWVKSGRLGYDTLSKKQYIDVIKAKEKERWRAKTGAAKQIIGREISLLKSWLVKK